MKSSRSDNHSHTTACKNCVFAVWTGDTQNACALGRVEVFLDRGDAFEAYDKEKEFFVVKGVCNTVRDKNWNNGEVSIAQVRREVRPTFLCIIMATNATQNMISSLKAMSDELDFDIEYHIVHSFKLGREDRENLRPLIDKLGCTVTECVDEDTTIGEIILRSKRSFTVVLDHLSFCDSRLFTRVDESLNDNLEKFVTYNLNSDVAISNLAYHIYSKQIESVRYSDVSEKVITSANEINLAINEVEE